MEDGTEEYLVPERRLVIGLDYGTTFTGIAYATPLATTCALNEIDVMTSWGSQMDNHDKVPSVISYSEPTEAKEQQWGSSLSPDATTMVHTKLELDVHDVSEELDLILQSLDGMKNLHFQHVKASGGLPAYTEKSAEEIVADYLAKVFTYLEKSVENFTKVLRDRISTDIVVTVPTGWSGRAMNSTYRALRKAGFNQESFPKLKEIIFVTEPEAAAIYTARYLKDTMGQDFLKEKGYFVLCDAGGGTVDVVSYKVKQLRPTLELEEIGCPTVRKCGSIFINIKFKEWLRDLLGDKNYQRLDPNTELSKITSHTTEGKAMRELMKEFDARKKVFRKDYNQDIHLDLPAPLDNLTILGKVNSGEITITSAVMSRFFDFCVAQIVELIKGHMIQIQRRGARPKNVFLVGGFGESEYLQGQIEDTLHLWDITLRRPDTSWTAVVRGAVICGIEKRNTQNLIRTSFCHHNYGVSVNQLFSDTYHPQQDLVSGASGLAMAQGQLLWLLNKGDVVLSNKPYKAEQDITVSFTKTEERQGTVTIYRYSDDDRPTRFHIAKEELDVAYVLAYDLSDVSLNEFELVRGQDRKSDCYVAVIKLIIILERNNLKASIWWKDTELSTADNIMY